jgi:malonyl CoA-acyl carrier protein transacylase
MSAAKTAIVICPGRGTYNKGELGVLGRHFTDRDLLTRFDTKRKERGQATLSELDGAERYSPAFHTRGDNASALIYAATLADFRALKDVEVVAVTGNSMGWYSALACAGAVSAEVGFDIANTMGALMQQHLIGGQTLYPFMGENWERDELRKAELLELVAEISAREGHVLTLSINLGGMLVLAGNEEGLSAFEAAVPPLQGRFPMRLPNHAGFHSDMQQPVAEAGRAELPSSLFDQPQLPLVDGRGHIWWPGACNTQALWDYTLGHQVVETYDFTRAIAHAAREFAPDLFIVTGPGTTLGGAVAQSLILTDWQDMRSKADFQARQTSDPILISMGMDDQRASVT